jgi:hypothetical protein
VFAQDELQLVLVHLELVLLEEHDLGALRDVDRADAAEALGLADQRQDLLVEVDVQLVVVEVADDERSLQASLGLVDLSDPLLAPQVLV